MPPLSLVALGGVDVIERPGPKMTAPAIAVGHDVFAVVVTLVDRVGIDRGRGDFRPLAGSLQRAPLRQAVLLPAERPQRRTAPRERPMSPEVRLGHVAVPILRQLRSQEFGLGGIGDRVIFGAPAGFQVLHIVGIVRHDLGELAVAPPGGQAVLGSFDDDPMALLLFSAGRVIAKGDPAGGDGRGRGYRQGHEHNYESRDTPQVGHEEILPPN